MSGLFIDSVGTSEMVVGGHAMSLDAPLSREDRAWLAEWMLREADEVIGRAHVEAESLRRWAEKVR